MTEKYVGAEAVVVRECARRILQYQVVNMEGANPTADAMQKVVAMAVSNHLLFAYHGLMKMVDENRSFSVSVGEAQLVLCPSQFP